MTDEKAPVEEQFDPTDHSATKVKEELKDADSEEKARIAGVEAANKARKSVLAAADVPEGVRVDSTGRRLNGWEVVPASEDA